MASSGSIYGSWEGGRDGGAYSDKYFIAIDWSITRQYFSGGVGYSDLHLSYWVKTTLGSPAWNGAANCYRSIEYNDPVHWTQNIDFRNYGYDTWYEIGSYDYTVAHNADGTKSCRMYLQIQMGSATTAGTGTVLGFAELDRLVADPTIKLTAQNKVSATRGGSNGSAQIAAEVFGGSTGIDFSYEISSNGQTTNASPLALTGLYNNTEYAFSGSIENSLGKTGSDSGTFYLDPVAPALTARVGSVGSDTAELIFTPVFDTKRRLAIYEVQYGPSLSYGQSASSGSLTGLTPETVYYFRARVTDANNGGASNDALTSEWVTGTFTTSPDQARIRIKTASGWAYGRVFIKQNGSWVRAKRVYIKSGTWKEGT